MTKTSIVKKSKLNKGSSQKKTLKKIEFTGERLIPELNKGAAFFYEHLARYLFSCQFVKDKTVLDAGCGAGYGSYILAKYGKAKKVYGLDISREAIEYAQSKYSHQKIRFRVDDAEKLATLKDDSIDVAVSFEVIEHLRNQEKCLTQIKRVLKKNGVFIVSTPNKYNYPEGNPFHTKELYPEEFYRLLKGYFKNVNFYHQGFEFSQVIKPEKNGEEVTLEEDFITLNQKLFAHPIDKKKSQYIIALCSDTHLPRSKLLSINSTKVDNFDLTLGLLSLVKQFNDLSNQINHLTSQLSQQQAENQQLKTQAQNLTRQLSQKSQENESLKKQLNVSSQQINSLIQEKQELKNQLNKVLALTELIKKEIEEKNRRIKTLENKFREIKKKEKEEEKRLIKENQRLQEQINQTKANIQNLEATLNMIKSAKFFKAWQGYCKVMKVLKLKS